MTTRNAWQRPEAGDAPSVALDLTPALSGLTGVARYALNLDAGLRARGVDVRAFAVGRGIGALPKGVRRLPIPLRMVAAGWRRGVPLRAELLTGDVDLVHSVDLDPPPCRAPLVMTIHDVAAIDFPQLHPPRATAAAQRRLRSLDRAAAIVAVSHATATAMTRHGIDVERITVVHGAAHALPSAPAVESGIDGPYLLAVGELTLRKDYPTLFRAFARADLPGYRLVVVGPRGFGAEQVEAAAADSELGDRLCLVGMVSDRRLSAIYAGASALCLTSYEEGFGLPLVEAMQRGLPIIASDIDVVHEIAGGAAATAPAGNVAEFAAAMEAVVRDGAVRERLRAAAVEQSAKFGWDATTDGIVEVYRRVLQR